VRLDLQLDAGARQRCLERGREGGAVAGARPDVVQRQAVRISGLAEELLRLLDVPAVVGGGVEVVVREAELRGGQDRAPDRSGQGAAPCAAKRLLVEC